MSAVETLRKARALLTPEGAWVKGYYAASRFHDSCPVSAPDAVCWCADGAIMRVRSEPVGMARTLLLRAIGKEPDTETGQSNLIIAWNDAPERTQAEVLAAFDRAIELAETAGAPQ